MISKIIKAVLSIKQIVKLEYEVQTLKSDLDALRSRSDLSEKLLCEFLEERESDEFKRVYEQNNPLVSVCIATYNRGEILVNRSLPSILDQDYKNLEVLVVGDCCTDDTESMVRDIGDPRIRFMNLPKRGQYPEIPEWRWMVAGTTPINHALSVAKGAFITHLDDDDEHQSDRVTKLVRFIQETRADMVWHPFHQELDADRWVLNEAREFEKGQVTTSSIFYHNWFKQIPWDINAYKYREPGDWNRLRKIKYLSAKLARYPEPLLIHYKERRRIHA